MWLLPLFSFMRDLVDWASGMIKKLSRRPNHDHNWEVHLRRDERQRERERLARELHDTLLQGFLGVSLQLQAAVEQVPENSPSKPALDRVTAQMQHVIHEARDILLGVRSSSMSSIPLEHSFHCLKDEFAADGAVAFRVFVTGQPKTLPPAIQEQIYLIGREALINAFRHSKATRIEAEVQYQPRRLRIFVRDNGCGMDPEIIKSGRHAHWGIVGMRERAAASGAQLRMWSRPGSGTEVEISIPNPRS
jgi:signal transduction histidine kinase